MCILLNVGLSKGFLEYVVNMTHYLINRSPLDSMEREVVDEVWIYNLINLDNLRIFRGLKYVHVSSKDRSKVEEVCLRQLCKGV